MASSSIPIPQAIHPWLWNISLAYVPGPVTPVLDEFTKFLLESFQRGGHKVASSPGRDTQVLFTSAHFGEPLNWRESMLFTARRRFQLEQAPVVFTLIHTTREKFQAYLDIFAGLLAKEAPDPADYAFLGMAPMAYHTLFEQGRRGGPILSLVRMLQGQAKCIRLILVLGEDHPHEAYLFDLVGSQQHVLITDKVLAYQDIMLRILTAASTHEVTSHQVVGEPVPHATWRSLNTPVAMLRAGRELGKRRFFTEMVRVDYLAHVPAVPEAVASQYSEGCYATWEPQLQALIATVTGSARPVEKDNLSEGDLAIITGVRPDGLGALVRHVEGKRNDPPSSESVEMMEMDADLPQIQLGPEWGAPVQVPVVRSKLHGHRGVKAYDPTRVEHVHLDAAYYHYPVSCATDAQARAIRSAFARSQALNDPGDSRQVVLTVLPGHGSVIVEKWVPGKLPFQVIWEYMDAGLLQIDNLIPQGAFVYLPNAQGRMVLSEE